jgi:hypothetical protein
LPERDLNSLSHRRVDAAVLEFGPTEIFPAVGAMHRAIPVSADRVAPARPTHPREKPGFSPREGKILRDADSPLEGDGFELPVPRTMQARLKAKIAGFDCMPPSIICGCRRWPSAQAQSANSRNRTLIARGNRKFESIPLQQRVCERSVPQMQRFHRSAAERAASHRAPALAKDFENLAVLAGIRRLKLDTFVAALVAVRVILVI